MTRCKGDKLMKELRRARLELVFTDATRLVSKSKQTHKPQQVLIRKYSDNLTKFIKCLNNLCSDTVIPMFNEGCPYVYTFLLLVDECSVARQEV